jgi:hypothetical protein
VEAVEDDGRERRDDERAAADLQCGIAPDAGPVGS